MASSTARPGQNTGKRIGKVRARALAWPEHGFRMAIAWQEHETGNAWQEEVATPWHLSCARTTHGREIRHTATMVACFVWSEHPPRDLPSPRSGLATAGRIMAAIAAARRSPTAAAAGSSRASKHRLGRFLRQRGNPLLTKNFPASSTNLAVRVLEREPMLVRRAARPFHILFDVQPTLLELLRVPHVSCLRLQNMLLLRAGASLDCGSESTVYTLQAEVYRITQSPGHG